MGILVHVSMLADAFFLPSEAALHTIKQIGLPVMLIFPITTVLLSLLILQQKERKESLIRALEAEERYESIFINSQNANLLIDPANGSILDANPAAAQFYGWTIEMLKSMTISQINTLNPEEITAEMEQATLEKRNCFLFRHRRAFGDPIDVEVHSTLIKYLKEIKNRKLKIEKSKQGSRKGCPVCNSFDATHSTHSSGSLSSRSPLKTG